jgi:hypothetical protein
VVGRQADRLENVLLRTPAEPVVVLPEQLLRLPDLDDVHATEKLHGLIGVLDRAVALAGGLDSLLGDLRGYPESRSFSGFMRRFQRKSELPV